MSGTKKMDIGAIETKVSYEEFMKKFVSFLKRRHIFAEYVYETDKLKGRVDVMYYPWVVDLKHKDKVDDRTMMSVFDYTLVWKFTKKGVAFWEKENETWKHEFSTYLKNIEKR